MKIEIAIKTILILLLFLCLLNMPYGYYQFVRWFSATSFVCLAFIVPQNKSNDVLKVIYIALAILFQPLIKISLGRELWNIIDIVVSILLGASIIAHFNKSKSN